VPLACVSARPSGVWPSPQLTAKAVPERNPSAVEMMPVAATGAARLPMMRADGGVIVIVLLALALAALLPLAYASPPDPTWLAGYWDDDDYDDVVLAAVQTVASVDRLTILELKPELLPGFIPPLLRPLVVVLSVETPYQHRAPPQP
jgi:hypothetical protein